MSAIKHFGVVVSDVHFYFTGDLKMNHTKVDRRIRYTKMMFRDALVAMLRDKHISGISVKELCELADVNRSTFYAHYRDPLDLLHQIEAEVFENVKLYLDKQEYIDYPRVSQKVLTDILTYGKENASLFEALLSENSDYAFQRDLLELSQIMSSQYTLGFNQKESEYLQAFATAGCVSVLQKWLRNGAAESPETISALVLCFLRGGMIGFAIN